MNTKHKDTFYLVNISTWWSRCWNSYRWRTVRQNLHLTPNFLITVQCTLPLNCTMYNWENSVNMYNYLVQVLCTQSKTNKKLALVTLVIYVQCTWHYVSMHMNISCSCNNFQTLNFTLNMWYYCIFDFFLYFLEIFFSMFNFYYYYNYC